MDFYDILDQVIDLLRSRGRLAYRALKRQFDLDDEDIEALKDELIDAQRLAVDENGRVLVWIGDAEVSQESTSTATQPVQPVHVEPPPEPTRPDAERRQLTVMFVDLVGSTSLSGKLDPEDYREVVREYQQVCSEVIQRYDGHVAQLLGDGLLVYFGYPTAHEDDAQRAVRSGLGIVEAIRSLNTSLESAKGVKLAIRLGIHTGLVVVGEMGGEGRQEQLALGETPNLAARIQGIAEPDTMVISHATYRLIHGYFDCETLGEHELRGVVQPMAVYHVLGDSGIQSRLDVASARGLTPLVGRESETTLLFERWEQAKDGNGQVILLSGEPGIGKSRLVQVLKDYVANEPHTRLECRSSPYFTNSALYPIIDMVQRTLRFQADDTPEVRLEKLEHNLSQYRLPLEETVPLFASLLLLPVPEDWYPQLNLSPQQQRQKTLETIVAITLELAARQLVLFILEDLHWTDPTTIELLNLLIDQTPTASLYVLLTCRPEFQPSWSHRSYLTEMTLNRLSRQQVKQVATQVAGGKALPAEVLEQLVTRTDGVPLYVEEMSKAILESGVLKEVDGLYELMGSITSLSIPATLQDSLMARLDHLVTAKGVAQYASVLGRQFSYELLQAVSELDEAMLQDELRRLVEAELVYQRGLPPQTTYFFKHALVQDAAYQSLLRSTRQGYHHRIAEILEERFPETAEAQPELLAHHFTEAGLSEQAVDYWQRAGARANQLSAYGEAIGHLHRGLDVLPQLTETHERARHELALLVALGPPLAAIRGGAAPEVERTYSRARALCQDMADSPKRFAVLAGLHFFYIGRGEPRTAHELGAQLLPLAQHLHDPILLPAAHMYFGISAWFLGDFRVAQTHLTKAWTSYRSQVHQDPISWSEPGLASCGRFLALTLLVLGYLEQARLQSHETLALVQELGYPLNQMVALLSMAEIHEVRGELQVALAYAQRAITLGQEQGFAQYGTRAVMARGRILIALGQFDEGLHQMQGGLAAWRATGMEAGLPVHLARLAESYVALGQTAAGFRVLSEARDFVERTDESWYESELYRLKGELTLQAGRENLDSDAQSEVEADFQQALDIARQQYAKSHELRAATSLARLWQSQGKRDDAHDILAPVYNWFTEGFDTADLIDAKALLVELEEEP